MVAAGHAIAMKSQREIEAYRARSQSSYWQERAWIYDDEVPEIGFAHDFTHHAMSRVRLIPAIVPDDPDEMPEPLTDENCPPGLDINDCRAVLSRLEPFPDFMGDTARKIDTAGECHVVLMEDLEALDGESCRVLSNDELIAQGDTWRIAHGPNDKTGEEIPPDTSTLFRIWTPSGRYGQLPMSPMRRLLGVAEELMLLTQVIRGQARSRVAMAGGILGIPDELTLEMTAQAEGDAEHDGDGEIGGDTFIEDFIDMATTAMIDHESAAAAIPLILRGKAELIEKIKMIQVGDPFDAELRNIRNELLGRVANGLDLPREVVLGVGENNHWNAEQIEQQAWHVHLEPRAMAICSATTQAFYRPQLLDLGVDRELVRRCLVWYDPSWFVGTPDLADSADAGLENYAISLETWRRVKGYNEDDAPDEAEVDYRISIKQREKVSIREVGDVVPPGIVDTQTGDEAGAPAKGGTPSKPTGTGTIPNENVDKSITAAGRVHVEGLGRRLVGIERDTRTRLQQAADSIVGRALERAGLKARNKLAGANVTLRSRWPDEQWKTLPAAEITRFLGPTGIAALGLSESELLAGALGDLEARYRSLVGRAQRAAGSAAAEATDRELDLDEMADRNAHAVDAGWALMAAGITAIVAGLLYNPDPKQPDRGEFDGASVVPLGLVRGALDRAGGAHVTIDGQRARDVTPGELQKAPNGAGATQGPLMQEVFAQDLGLQQEQYRWTYGDTPRTREFEPHLDLDGVTFEDWDSDVLTNNGDFPVTDYFAPGDHDGCACDYESLYSVSDEERAANAELPPIEAELLGGEGSALSRTAELVTAGD